MDRIEPIYVISVAAKLCELHPQTLRMYERRGLISPQRSSKSTRLYSMEDVEHLRRIQQLVVGCGLNLAGVERVPGNARVWELHARAGRRDHEDDGGFLGGHVTCISFRMCGGP